MCCQVEVSATGRSLVQRRPTDCGVSLCVISKPQERGDPGPRWAVAPKKKKRKKKNKGKVVFVHAIKVQYRHQMETSCQLHAQATLPPRKDHVAHWTGSRVRPTAGLEVL